MPKAQPLSAFDATYEKGPILGRGASGVAFVVRPKGGPEVQQVAKEICVSRFDEKRRKEAFEESKLLRALNHDNIVKCMDTFLDDEVLYIIMEYANGGDLGRCIQARRKEPSLFPEIQVMGVFVQICAALLHIHSRRILHRDLKPANVFIVGEGDLSTCTVKLGDFGIAKMLEGTTCQAHSTVGTPSYLSPEICKNHPYGTKSDIWSLGVVLYELAVLKVPFQAGNLPAMALMICTNEPKPLPDSFSEPLENLKSTLLLKDPAKRPPIGDILHSSYVQRYLSESLVRCIANDIAAQAKPKVQTAQSRGASVPNREGRAADPQGASRLPSCGPSTGASRQRPEKFLLQQDASQWCWLRTNSSENSLTRADKIGATPQTGQTGRRAQRSERGYGDRSDQVDRGEKLDRGERAERATGSRAAVPQLPDRTVSGASEGAGVAESGGATGSRMPPADRSDRERSDRADTAERPDKADRGDRDKSDKPDRADRPSRGADRPERLERLDRIDRPDRGDRGDRAERAERLERSDRTDRNNRADRGNRERTRVPEARPERGDQVSQGSQGSQGYRSDPPSRSHQCECNGNCETCERGERCFWLEKAALGSRGGTPDEGTEAGGYTVTVDSVNAQEQSPLVDTTDEEFNGTPGPACVDACSPQLQFTSPMQFSSSPYSLGSSPRTAPPPAAMSEPAPPGTGPPLGTGLTGEFQPRVRNKKLRRGRPPLLTGQDNLVPADNSEARSPTRINKGCFEGELTPDRRPALSSTAPVNSSAPSSAGPTMLGSTAPLSLHHSTARSISPARALGELQIPNFPVSAANSTALLRPSGSTPALPPLPPLLAPARGPVVRSRSVASIHDVKKEQLQRGSVHMFRTAPLPVSGSRDRDGNAGQGPAPPSLTAPSAPPQHHRQHEYKQQPPPPPSQRQAQKDDSSGVRLAPKLLAAVTGQSDGRHRREATSGSMGRAEAAAVCEGWCDADSPAGVTRLSSARLQPVV